MIKFKIYKQYGALNSGPVLDALEQSILSSGNMSVDSGEDVSVIWSVLWKGRMLANRAVYEMARRQNKTVMIAEVGNLVRGQTWRISLDNVNALGHFAKDRDLDSHRPAALGLKLKEPKLSRQEHVVIAGQQDHSLQWGSNQPSRIWFQQMAADVRSKTQRPILLRPHPREVLLSGVNVPGATIYMPKKIEGTYDSYDIDFDCHCVINHNSGPAILAAIEGTPVICDKTSLAYPVSGRLEDIETVTLKERSQWFLELCHTEWTVEEIGQGIPLARLLPEITRRKSR